MKREFISREEAELFFPLVQREQNEFAIQQLEQVFINLRNIKKYIREQRDHMDKEYPDEVQGRHVLHYLHNVLLSFVKENDE